MADKTDAVNLRMAPKVRYFAQLIAKGRNISFARLIELALNEEIAQADFKDGGEWQSLTSLIPELWADHPGDRLALIGNRFPHLLTVRERILWEQVICKRADFWRVPLKATPIRVSKKTFNFERLRECWDEINLERETLRKQAESLVSSLNPRIRRRTHPTKKE